MGMGYCACTADIVSEEFVREICPSEMNKIDGLIRRASTSWADVASALRWEEGIYDLGLDEDQASGLNNAVGELYREFANKTQLGLYLIYHDQHDDGDRYDDIDGYAFGVEGVFERTDAGRKYAKQIQQARWVEFG